MHPEQHRNITKSEILKKFYYVFVLARFNQEFSSFNKFSVSLMNSNRALGLLASKQLQKDKDAAAEAQLLPRLESAPESASHDYVLDLCIVASVQDLPPRTSIHTNRKFTFLTQDSG